MRLYCSKCEDTNDVDWMNDDGPAEMDDDPPSSKWYLERFQCSKCETLILNPVMMTPLIDESFDQACKDKFRIGRVEHGPVFLGDPLAEIDMELIDAVNYAEEAIRQGFDLGKLTEIIDKLKEVDTLVRTLYRTSISNNN